LIGRATKRRKSTAAIQTRADAKQPVAGNGQAGQWSIGVAGCLSQCPGDGSAKPGTMGTGAANGTRQWCQQDISNTTDPSLRPTR